VDVANIGSQSGLGHTPPGDLPLPILEEKCPGCRGRGWQRGRGGQERCPLCDGAGYTTTEFGRRILALMRHNFKPMLQDAGYD
jgi:hypothetical protein